MPKRRSKVLRGSLQATRRDLAILKKKGLFTGNPKKAPRSKKNLSLIKQYKKVLSGKADVWSIKPEMARRYKRAHLKGIKVASGDKVIVDKKLGYSRTRIIKGDPVFENMIAHVKPLENGEIETVVLPERFTNVIKMVEGLKTNPEWNGLKKSKENFTFRINGAPALQGQGFRTLSALADYLSHYKQVADKNYRGAHQLYDLFEIVRVKRGFNLRADYEGKFHGHDRTGRSRRSRYRER